MNKHKRGFKELNKNDESFFHGGHHTNSQLYYMVDLFEKDVLTSYIARKWENKFNTNMTDNDRKEFNREINILQLDLFEIYEEMKEYYNI